MLFFLHILGDCNYSIQGKEIAFKKCAMALCDSPLKRGINL